MLGCDFMKLTAAEVLHEALVPRNATSLARKAQLYADAMETSRKIFTVLESVCRENGVMLRYPEWRAGGGSDSIMNWCEALFDQMHSDKIGRISYDGSHATYNWYEVKKESGILNHSLTRLKSTHTILNPKARRLPVGFDVPAKAKRILAQIESEDVLCRACRVVQGMLVGEKQEVSDKWKERTTTGKALDMTKAFAVQTAQVIGDGIVGMAAVAGEVAIAAGSVALAAGGVALASVVAVPMMAAAAVDPAIVIGDVVFFGWKD